MKTSYFNFSQKVEKLRTKSLVMSSISLFIGITHTLPTKIAILGLDLSGPGKILGWLIFTVTLILALYFFILSILELIKKPLQKFIEYKNQKTTGEIIGLTKDEIFSNFHSNKDKNSLPGSLEYEIESIDKKEEELKQSIKNTHIDIYNLFTILFEFVLPLGIGICGLNYLYCFLIS